MKAEWTNKDVLTQSETTGKSVLVIDKPKNCSECKLIFLQGIGEAICNPVDWEERPTWCPLKPMPQPKGYIDAIEWHLTKKDSAMFIDGWNACIEALEDLQNGEDSNE